MTKFFLLPDSLLFNGSRIASDTQTTFFDKPGHTIQNAGDSLLYGEIMPPSFNSDLNYDPLSTIVEWYGSSIVYYNLSRYSSDKYLFNLQEVSEWINENSAQPCYTRREHSHWKMGFVDQTDYCNFEQWIAELQKTPFPLLKIPDNSNSTNFSRELTEWCHANFTGSFAINTFWVSNGIQIRCKDRRDLVLLRLRWGEHFAK